MSSFESGIGVPTLAPPDTGTIPSLAPPGGNSLPTLQLPTRVGAPALGASPSPTNLNRIASISQGQQILDQVRNRQLSWQQANSMLSTYPQDVRNELLRQLMTKPGSSPDEMRAVAGKPKTSITQVALSPFRTAEHDVNEGAQIGGNLITDTAATVRTSPAGLVSAARLIGHDEWNALRNHPGDPLNLISAPFTGSFGREAAKGFAASEKQSYGQLVGGVVHGDPAEIGRGIQQIKQHPLQPILDALAVASGGLGTVGRASTALEAADTAKAINTARSVSTVTHVGNDAVIGDGVGTSLRVTPGAGPGAWRITDSSGNAVAGRFPTKDAAIQHAQTVRTGGVNPNVLSQELAKLGVKDTGTISPLRAGLTAGIKAGQQGSLLEAYNRARGITYDQENGQIGSEILDSLTDPNAPQVKPPVAARVRQTFGEALANLKETRNRDVAELQRLSQAQPGFFATPVGGLPMKALTTTLRETTDFVRAGAIFLRSAYLPNNWAGNFFLNAIDQGVLAPLNLAKSMAAEKFLSADRLRALDRSTGFNSLQSFLGPRGGGYVNSITDPIAHMMGRIGDQPFRRAQVLHELRRKGYTTFGDINGLFDRIEAGDNGALTELADAGRRAQEATVKFGNMGDIEKQVARHIIFVYSWMKGAGRYFARFPFQHPIQAAVFGHLGQMGQDYLDQHMGGVPTFLVGAIPIGRTKDGNPILINPFTVNPLGTGVELAQAAAGTVAAAKGGTSFNKYAQEDILGLANPLVKSYVESREGGRSVPSSIEGSIAGVRLAQDLQHPGRGGVYPTSRKEALGQFFIGTLYPRVASQQSISRSLARENAGNPVALIPQEVSDYEKLTGAKVPKEFQDAYAADLASLQQEKDFKHSYAESHGRQGFTNMPARNQAEAAIEYLQKNKLLAPADLQSMTDALDHMPNDAALRAYANRLWRMTGAGAIKRTWDRMMNEAKARQPPTKEIP